MRIGDFNHAERAFFARITPRVGRDARGLFGTTDDDIDFFLSRSERLKEPDRAGGVRKPGRPRGESERAHQSPGQGEKRPGDEERRRPAHEEPVRNRAHARPREPYEVYVDDEVERDERGHHGAEERGHRDREKRVDAEEHARGDREPLPTEEPGDEHDRQPSSERQQTKRR